MNIQWLYIGAALLLDGAVGLAGGLLPEHRLVRHRALFVGFAAGALLGAAFLDVLPEAIEAAGSRAMTWALGAFMLTTLLGRMAANRWPTTTATRSPGLPVKLLGSDALHNIGDGAIIAAAFFSSTGLGVVTTFAVLAHELPQEVGDYVLLRAAGIRRGPAILALAAVQMTALIGAAAVAFASSLFARTSGVVLAVAGGTFLQIGATDLLPEVLNGEGEPRGRTIAVLGLLLGIAAIAAVQAI
ncbi:MAG: ZIP family metal transporter [Minicystis sp.]